MQIIFGNDKDVHLLEHVLIRMNTVKGTLSTSMITGSYQCYVWSRSVQQISTLHTVSVTQSEKN